MSFLYLIRHGETPYTTARRFCGHRDPPLNERGLLQAAAVARHLASHTLTAVFASDLLRARETASGLASPRGMSVQVVSGLKEMGFGAWEGMTWKEIQARDPEVWEGWMKNPASVTPPGGEGFIAFADRVWDAFVSLSFPTDGGDVAVVAHGGTLRVLVGRLQGLSLPDIPWMGQRPAAVNVIRREGEKMWVEGTDVQVWEEGEMPNQEPLKQ